MGPTHGGPIRRGEERSSAPLRNAKFVVRNETSDIASFTTDESGKFSVGVPPGHYTIVSAGGLLPRCGTVSVDVTAENMASVTIGCDSGMR